MSYLNTKVDLCKGYVHKYGMNVIEYEIGEAIEKGRYLLPSSRLFPVSLKNKMKARDIELKLEFCGANAEEVATNIAEFSKLILDGADIYLPDGYGYFCVVDKFKKAKQITSWINTITVSLVGVRHGTKVTEKVQNGTEIHVTGMIDTEAIITMTPSAGSTNATVVITEATGKEMTNVTVKNISGTVVVDGVTTKVTENGLNKFNDAELFEFPKLSAGNNIVKVTGAVDVSVSYYPLYL